MIDYNDPLVQLESIKLMKPITSFLTDIFVEDKGALEAEDAIWDCKRGDVPMAPFVHDTTGGVPVGRNGYITENMKFPTLAPERIVKPIDIKQRGFGEAVYGGMTAAERAEKMIADDLMDLRAMIQKRREWMLAQLLFNGKIDIVKHTGVGAVEVAESIIDFDFKNNYVATNKWDSAGSDISKDIDAVVDMVNEGLGSAEVIVMAPDVKAALFANEKYQKMLDIRNYQAGELRTQYRQNGVIFLGYTPGGQEMYVYSRTYEDAKGKKHSFVPSGKLVVGSRQMINMYHGPVTMVTEDGVNGTFATYIEKEVPCRFSDSNSNTVKQRLISRPMFVPKNVDGWAVAQVL